MARGTQMMKQIEEAIVRLERERAEYNKYVDGKLEAFREALKFHGGTVSETADPPIRKRARRGNLKETVIEMAELAGDKGVTADECIAMAKQAKGIELVPGSVSSLLSRLKTDGVMFFDGHRYRLKQYAGPRHAA